MNWTKRIFAFFCFGVVAISVTLPYNLGYADIPKGALIGAWLFDEGEGDTVEDSSGNGNDITIAEGQPGWVEGRFGEAMEFDGVLDYLAAPDSASLDSIDGQAMSILAWVNGANFAGSARHILRKVHDTAQESVYMLRVQNNILRLYLGTDAEEIKGVQFGYVVDGIAQLEAGDWVHLAAVYNGKELQGYINGELDVTLPAQGNIVTTDQELRIGRGDPGGYFTGIMDEVGLFKAALTEDQIKEIMEKGLQIALAIEPNGKLSTMWGAIKQ